MDTENFIKQFEDCYFLACGEKLELIKKPAISKLEDGSTLVEWIFAKFRVGFSFEPPKNDSFFYIIGNKELNSLTYSEIFKTQSDLEIAIKKTVDYIIENKDK